MTVPAPEERTSAMISFSGPPDPDEDTHVRISLGSEGGASDGAPYSFTIMIANAKVSLSGISTTATVVERLPMSREQLRQLKAWLDLEVL